MQEYKQILINTYDALCIALTNYENAEEVEDYNKNEDFYAEIVDIVERLENVM